MRLFLSLLVFLGTLTANAQNQVDSTIQVCLAGKCQSGELSMKDILRSTGVLLLDSEKN
jgi:hypothetical protein